MKTSLVKDQVQIAWAWVVNGFVVTTTTLTQALTLTEQALKILVLILTAFYTARKISQSKKGKDKDNE